MWEWMYLEGIAMVVEDITQTRYVRIHVHTYFIFVCLTSRVADTQAMALIKQASLSAALFAPGWVYETQEKSYFFDNQDKYVGFPLHCLHSTVYSH